MKYVWRGAHLVRKTGLWRYELTEGPYEQAVQSPKHKVMLFTPLYISVLNLPAA